MKAQAVMELPVIFPDEIYAFGERSGGGSHGVVLTKPHIVELILDQAGYTPDEPLHQRRLLEPACGPGAFVVLAVRRLLAACARHGADVAKAVNAIAAYDIDAEAVRVARRVVSEELVAGNVSSKVAVRLADGWIKRADFLLTEQSGTFDYVVGNPPYIRIEQLAAELQTEYRRRFTTIYDRADLYVAFIEKGLRLLSEDATLSYICADRWTLNRYGAPLRQLVADEFGVHTYIDLHQASPFQSEVIAYPSIFVIGRQKRLPVRVAKLAKADAAECMALSATLTGRASMPDRVPIASYEQWFDGDEPWTITPPEHLAVLRNLEAEFRPLEADEQTRVGIGVASGCDRVYIVSEGIDIEHDRLVPLVLRTDIDRGKIRNAGRYIINPFSADGKVIDLGNYPRLAAYFESHSVTLRARHVAKKNKSGWFRTIDRVYPELVIQPKLLIPDIAGSNEVTYDEGHYHPHHNLYYVTSSSWDLEVLGALLSSKVALFFIWSYAVKMRGGYLRFQAQYLRRIRVPAPASINKGLAASLKRAFRQRNFAELDSLALEAYGLTCLPSFDFVDTRR